MIQMICVFGDRGMLSRPPMPRLAVTKMRIFCISEDVDAFATA